MISMKFKRGRLERYEDRREGKYTLRLLTSPTLIPDLRELQVLLVCRFSSL